MPDGVGLVSADTKAARGSLAAAANLIEARVVGIGDKLGTALSILDLQTKTFDALSAELGGPDAAMAAGSLGKAIMQIERSSHTHAQAAATLATLSEQIARLARRVDAMGLLAEHAMTLALYMRLEGARIADDGGEFVGFAEDANQATRRMHGDLLELGSEIGAAASKVASATQDHASFAGSHDAKLADAAARLRTNLVALDDQRRHVQVCGGEVAERSRNMRRHVGQAVQALQIGDTTRQRLEHAHESIVLLDAILPESRRSPAGYRIVADQISDAVADFTREVTRVAGGFRVMAADADRIVQLGEVAQGHAPNGSDTAGRSGLLARVRDDTQDVLLTIGAGQAARKTSHGAMEAVLLCVAVLRERVAAIHEMQAKLHIMGLNVTLKCARLGRAGTSIGAITQDLRGCSRRMAEEAARAVVDLAELARVAETSGDHAPAAGDAGAEAEADRPEQLIAAALATLTGMDERIKAALSALAQDGETVRTLLHGGASAIAVESDLTRLTESAVAALPRQSMAYDALDAGETEVLSRIFALYTMAREREVHRAVLGDEATLEPADAIAVDIDDLLF